MKTATAGILIFGILAVAFMARGASLLIFGSTDGLGFEDALHDQQAGTRMQLTAAIFAACAVGCWNVRAIKERTAGQVVAKNEAIENA